MKEVENRIIKEIEEIKDVASHVFGTTKLDNCYKDCIEIVKREFNKLIK
jgi:hypothetical protein